MADLKDIRDATIAEFVPELDRLAVDVLAVRQRVIAAQRLRVVERRRRHAERLPDPRCDHVVKRLFGGVAEHDAEQAEAEVRIPRAVVPVGTPLSLDNFCARADRRDRIAIPCAASAVPRLDDSRAALVRTYLYGIALNLLAAERRKQSKDAPVDSSPEPAVSGAPYAVLWVRQALQKLDPSEREIIMLREYEQLSYSEIADLLRLPLNTVRSRLFRSRMALKGYLESESKPERHVAAAEPANSSKEHEARNDK